MDHTKLLIFLLIVLGTVATFGSPITEDYPEDYSERPEEYPEMSPDKTKELDTLKSDPDMGIFHEMTRNSKEHEALMRSDPALGNYPEMVPNSKEIEALRMRSSQSNPAIEMTPEFQEHGKLLSNTRDQDGKIVKRAARDKGARDKGARVQGGDVISGADLGISVLQSVLDAIGSAKRKIAIGVDNESGHEWIANNVYFYSGASEVNLPLNVSSGKALLWGARKTLGPVARGAVGVFTYRIRTIDKTLAVMYSVPFDHNLYKNWWNVELYSGDKRADESMFDDMYYSNAIKGDNAWHNRYLGSNLSFTGAMTSSGTATLQIKVTESHSANANENANANANANANGADKSTDIRIAIHFMLMSMFVLI